VSINFTVHPGGEPMYNKILVPIDLDNIDHSIGILPSLVSLAQPLGSDVVLMTVLDPDSIEEPVQFEEGKPRVEIANPRNVSPTVRIPIEETGESPHEDALQQAKQAAENRIVDMVKSISGVGIKVDTIVSVGDPGDVILETVEGKRCEFIAMSVSDRNILSRLLFGSATDKVLRSSPVPVLAINPKRSGWPPAERARISNIVAVLDETKDTEPVLYHVKPLARGLSAQITLASVVEEIIPNSPEVVIAEGGKSRKTLEQDPRTAFLTNIAADLAGEGFNVRWELIKQDLEFVVEELKRAMPDTLIAIAPRDETLLDRWLPGGLVSQLIRATGRSFFVIPSPATESGA
jgi:nucleotide-binding universal stress UspA family protein